MKPTMTLGQHMMIELLLTMEQPVTIARVAHKIASGPAREVVQPTTLRMRLEKLVELGWLTKGSAISIPGRRGKPPTEYALVAGAARAWQQREAQFQQAYREQQRWDEALLA
jgi:hypothetical protein